ncbi:MAG TPA: TonB-dependent siderophore receptor [Burkholderiaceae bacterium]|nr:TonB-dependent siderophore receptor [Burkholderiaceae bacterium]
MSSQYFSSARVRRAAALAAYACWATPIGAQQTEPTLPAVVVSASPAPPVRADGASVGSFTDAPLLQTPSSITVVTHEQIQNRAIRQTSDAMKWDASVNDAYNAVGYAEQFSIRGFALDNMSSYRKDGLAISADDAIALENKQQIEVLKGLAGLQAGAATPGGILNYVTKRPTATALRSVTVETRERGSVYGAVDLGGRFSDQRFGYRINAAAEKLRSYVRGADGERQFVSSAFDWRISPQALLQLDLDYQHRAQLTAPGFQLFDGMRLPTGIDPSTMLNDQPWSKPVKTHSDNLGLRFEYQFNDDWHATLSANRNAFRRDDYTAFPYSCSGLTYPTVGFCSNGDYDVYDYQSVGERKTLLTSQALLQGTFSTGRFKHAFTVGAAASQRRDEFGDAVFDLVGTSNIYNPAPKDASTIPASTNSTGPVSLRRRQTERAIFAQDILRLSDAFKLHAGARYTQLQRDQFEADGSLGARYDRSYLLPNLALVFNPVANWSLYGAYSEGLEHGGIAPLGTANVNQMLDPSISRQLEIGVKAELAPDLALSAALFQIRKPLEFTNSSNTYVRHGDAVHRGLELAAQGQATRQLLLGASLTALDASQRHTGDATLDGRRVTNLPRFKSVLYLDYAVPQFSGLGLNGSWQYASSKAFNPDNSVTVPAYHVLNLGARYTTRVAGARTTLRLNVDNVLDRFYWRDVSQELGGYLFPGAPRTFRLSAQFDF